MLKKPDISIIICTHNRADTLDTSLQHYQDLIALERIEILVVLNACTDQSEEVVLKWQKKITTLRSITSEKLGHSHARNDGLEAASAPFVFYIDDDAYPNNDLAEILITNIEEKKLKCISGRTTLWKETSPKWIKEDLVATPIFRTELGLMPEHGYLNGCACGFDKKILQELGGFDPLLGMQGNKLGYYDEVHVQQKFSENGYEIYFDPNLLVYHRSHQRSIADFYKAALAKGSSARIMEKYNKNSSYRSGRMFKDRLLLIFEIFKAVISLPFNIIRSGIRSGFVLSFNRAVYLAGKNMA